MQNFIRKCATKTCLTFLGIAFLAQGAYALDNTKMSYLDSVSASYLYNKPDDGTRILNTNSDEARGFEASFKLDSRPMITNSDVKIKLSLRDSDIKQVLRMLADKAGVNIIFDQSIEGKITLDLNDISINDAFLLIFKTMQYTYVLDKNTLTVMTLEAYKSLAYTRQNMTVLPIKYVSAESVASFLNGNLFSSNIFGLSNNPIVTSNPRTNQIIVFGSNADVSAIKRILPVLDAKPMINNFKVNHTTPKEMANLVCDTLFYDSGDAGSTKGSENNSLDSEEMILGGGIVACRDKAAEDSGDGEGLSSFKANALTVAYFPEQGRISTIGGSVEQVQVIGDFIKEHDKKQLMAYIELSVVELNEEGSKTFNNTWNLWTPFISLGFDPKGGLTTSSTNPFFLWGNKYPTVLKTIDKDGNETSEQVYNSRTNSKALVYALKYSVESGNGRVLTNPKIMVTNGRKAKIDMTSDYVKSVTSQVLTSAGEQGTTQKTYDIGSDEGILIEIVPFISPDGYVSMNISPEFATVKSTYTDENGDPQVTLLQRRDLELKNIRIRDGETLVLAGLIKESEQQNVNKMPVLADLPLVGAFFRANYSTKRRDELVILVTPHIILDKDNTDSNVYDL